MSSVTDILLQIAENHTTLLESVFDILEKQKKDFAELKAEFAATKVKLDHLEATVNHE